MKKNSLNMSDDDRKIAGDTREEWSRYHALRLPEFWIR